MASSSDPRELLPQLVSDEDVQARAKRNVREQFVVATRRWRSAPAAVINCLGYLAVGLLPAIPGSEPLFGVDWRISLGLMGVHCLNTILGVFIIARFHPLSLPGKAIEVFGTTWFIGSAAVLIAVSGSVRVSAARAPS